jgi:hypothetical protein
MKTRSLTIIWLFLFATPAFTQQTKVDILKGFLNGIIMLDDNVIGQQEPIADIAEVAAKTAAKTIALTKENIASALNEAKSYKSCIIITGRHTIAKITDHNDCVQSGAWGACMPAGAGYIQKSGGLNQTDGYINNIIGVPDGQVRTLYLFNN